MSRFPSPFALSLSKGAGAARACFDKLSTNGFCFVGTWVNGLIAGGEA